MKTGNSAVAALIRSHPPKRSATIELRKRFRGDDDNCEWQYKFGLIGSPHREFVIRDMESAISLREQPVTSHFIDTLALLEFTRQAPAVPPYPSGNDDEQISQWQIQMDRRQSIYDELRLNHLRQLVMAISQGCAYLFKIARKTPAGLSPPP